MVKLFTNKELAARLGINPARWKRWSREFLPPDPLAGRQSGYARQYYLNDAFAVFLGGHLVSSLRMAVPEARKVLRDLKDWLKENGYRFDPAGGRYGMSPDAPAAARHTITAYQTGAGGFVYWVKGAFLTEFDTVDGWPVVRETFTEKWITPRGEGAPELESPKTIPVSLILEKFLKLIQNNHQRLTRKRGTEVEELF